MSHVTKIEWTDRATNPIRYRDAAGQDVWACVKVSAGCKHCYAEASALRFGKGGAFSPQNMADLTPYLRDKEVDDLLSRKKTPPGCKVFVGDMTDVFGHWVPDDLLNRLFAVFALRTDVVFQVLTKRPERMAEWATAEGREEAVAVALIRTLGPGDVPDHLEDVVAHAVKWSGRSGRLIPAGLKPWPLPNVWVGTSVEDQQAADARIPHLLKVPGAVRFLSMEPLLGPVDLSPWLARKCGGDCGDGRVDNPAGWGCRYGHACQNPPHGIGWVIVGGESGHNARAMNPDWARSIRDQCQAVGVPFFFKQWGEWLPGPLDDWKTQHQHHLGERPDGSHVHVYRHGYLARKYDPREMRLIDGRTWDETPEVVA